MRLLVCDKLLIMSHGSNVDEPKWMSVHIVGLQERNTEFREPNLLQCAVSMPYLCLRERYYLYYTEQ